MTQWQVVGCCQTISEAHLLPVLEAILHQFPLGYTKLGLFGNFVASLVRGFPRTVFEWAPNASRVLNYIVPCRSKEALA